MYDEQKEKPVKAPDPGRVGAGKFWASQSRGIAMACEGMILAYITIYCTNTMGMSPALVGTQLIQRGCLLYAVGMLLYFFAGSNIVLIIIAGFIGGCGSLPIAYMNYQMILDCASYNEWKGHAKMEDTMTSITGFASKIGAAFGAGLLGILLSASGFVSGSEGLSIAQPDSAVLMIRLLMTLIPMAFYLLLAFVLRFYKLDDLMPQICADLEAKHAAEAAEAAET